MGDRGQVLIKDEGVYLYTHWSATELVETVKTALAKRWRWDDPEYLARIIFNEMTKGSEMEETGYGIGSSKHGDIWRLITIDCSSQTISLEDDDKVKWTKSFDEFINDQRQLPILASYIIQKRGNIIEAINGKTGKIDFSGTDAATVIQNAINALTSGGTIYLKELELPKVEST